MGYMTTQSRKMEQSNKSFPVGSIDMPNAINHLVEQLGFMRMEINQLKKENERLKKYERYDEAYIPLIYDVEEIICVCEVNGIEIDEDIAESIIDDLRNDGYCRRETIKEVIIENAKLYNERKQEDDE
jgi:hypothetical protein